MNFAVFCTTCLLCTCTQIRTSRRTTKIRTVQCYTSSCDFVSLSRPLLANGRPGFDQLRAFYDSKKQQLANQFRYIFSGRKFGWNRRFPFCFKFRQSPVVHRLHKRIKLNTSFLKVRKSVFFKIGLLSIMASSILCSFIRAEILVLYYLQITIQCRNIFLILVQIVLMSMRTNHNALFVSRKWNLDL